MFMMQLFSEIELPEERRKEREKDALREDNVGLRFLPITTNGFYRRRMLHICAAQPCNRVYPFSRSDRTASSSTNKNTK